MIGADANVFRRAHRTVPSALEQRTTGPMRAL